MAEFLVPLLIYATTICHTQPYVLLAANLEDFKTLAKKIVPEKLALQLAELASASNVKYRQAQDESKDADESETDYVEEETEHAPHVTRMDKSSNHKVKKTKNEQPSKITFESLVEKVKKRIHNDMTKTAQIAAHKNSGTESTDQPEGSGTMDTYAEHNLEEYRQTDNPSRQQIKHIEKSSIKHNHYNGDPDILLTKSQNQNKKRSKKGQQDLIGGKNNHDYEETITIQTNEPHVSEENNMQFSETANLPDYSYEEYAIKTDHNAYEKKETPNRLFKERPVGKPKMGRHHDVSDRNAPENNSHYNSQLKYKKRQEKHGTEKDTNDKVYEDSIAHENDEYDMKYAKIQISTNDSYEDYVTPKRDRDIYESDKTPKKTTYEFDRNEKNDSPKAKTEDLWYNDKESDINNRNKHKQTTPVNNKKGTKIPKRDYFRMSSPNYLAKVPVVAEKYDFDESIPENDRVEEKYKTPKGLPPLKINGRVKLN